mgnify:CR=1 FL=1
MGFFTEGAQAALGTAKRKPTLTDVESNKAQRLESVASRVPTLQALAWRNLPADEYASLPEPVRHSVLALDPNRPQAVDTANRGGGNLLYRYGGANDRVLHAWDSFANRDEHGWPSGGMAVYTMANRLVRAPTELVGVFNIQHKRYWSWW